MPIDEYMPFVCHKVPFICIGATRITPSVGRYSPFIGSSGLTLVEVVVTLLILAILATFATPAMRNLISEQRLSTQANDLLADLNFARSEAIRRGMRVTICKSSNATASSPSCNSTAGVAWTAGRVVFADAGTVGTIDSAPTDTVLRIRPELEGSASGSRLLGDASVGDPMRVTYLPTGLIESYTVSGTTYFASGDIQQFRVCDDRGSSYGRAVVINNTGRARIAARGQSKSGGALSCS